ncbi:phosphonate C-P lyase system protein PhnH [Billgrantia endophytica]|uniref:Phosphonate C-P lyase system protein PhnH n=1 Tax=Billgrantia endophytica TaxID=2033802 RepID=A0A2N7U1P6_9GAMM|nr:phosphonate C-P lyase system protein PhnH [Halomonas endophytica]PMR74340.1 phosphonate C-P lyase system protein PhnH [Halomonas endophytica]
MPWQAFADPVHDSQRLFRQLLTAMAEPGTLHEVLAPSPPGDSPLGPAAWGVLLTLCDLDSRLWIDPSMDSDELREALAFHGGCRFTARPAEADFALVVPERFEETSLAFAEGSDSYPDRSTTLIVLLDVLVPDGAWQLSGPGIRESRRLGVGPGAALMKRLQANRTRFPLGLDTVLTCAGTLTAIPRSTRIFHIPCSEESAACM